MVTVSDERLNFDMFIDYIQVWSSEAAAFTPSGPGWGRASKVTVSRVNLHPETLVVR